MEQDFTATAVTIPCCLCGTMISPNPLNMCHPCLREKCELDSDLPETLPLTYCKSCGRYQVSQTQWASYELESPELLQFCLKRINALKEHKLIEAKFKWREPHSQRIEVVVTFENESFEGLVLRKTAHVVFIIEPTQCPECCELATPREHWKAIVQLRQHVSNKRTMFWIEQQILSRDAHHGMTAIERKRDGLDFQFNDRPAAEKLIGFLRNLMPLTVHKSSKLVGEDFQSNVKDTRFTYSLTCPPISRQDLIVMPKHLVDLSGNRTRLSLCLKMGKKMTFIDPLRGTVLKIDGKTFWGRPFDALLSHDRMSRFVILSKELTGETVGKWAMAEFEITDEDTYEDRIIVKSHLGNILHEGDVCHAYDLRETVFPDDITSVIDKVDFSKIIIVAKARTEPKQKKRPRRVWKLKNLAPVHPDDTNDFEDFMDDLEIDDDLRTGVVAFTEDGNQETDIPVGEF